MLITIICIAILAVGITLLIISDHWWRAPDAFEYVGTAGAVLGGIGTLTCLILILIFAPKGGPIYNGTKIGLEEDRAQLTSTYEYLTTTEPSDISRIEVNEYNKNVAEYKSNIRSMKYCINSVWINWFISPAWSEFNEEDVSYIS